MITRGNGKKTIIWRRRRMGSELRGLLPVMAGLRPLGMELA
jgi:hypothetical protein